MRAGFFFARRTDGKPSRRSREDTRGYYPAYLPEVGFGKLEGVRLSSALGNGLLNDLRTIPGWFFQGRNYSQGQKGMETKRLLC